MRETRLAVFAKTTREALWGGSPRFAGEGGLAGGGSRSRPTPPLAGLRLLACRVKASEFGESWFVGGIASLVLWPVLEQKCGQRTI